MHIPDLSALVARQQKLLADETSKRCSFRMSDRVQCQTAVTVIISVFGLTLSILNGSGAYLNLTGAIVISLGIYWGLTNFIRIKLARDLPQEMLREHVSLDYNLNNNTETDEALTGLHALFDDNPKKWSALMNYNEYEFTKFFAKYDAAMVITGTLSTGIAGFL